MKSKSNYNKRLSHSFSGIVCLTFFLVLLLNCVYTQTPSEHCCRAVYGLCVCVCYARFYLTSNYKSYSHTYLATTVIITPPSAIACTQYVLCSYVWVIFNSLWTHTIIQFFLSTFFFYLSWKIMKGTLGLLPLNNRQNSYKHIIWVYCTYKRENKIQCILVTKSM